MEFQIPRILLTGTSSGCGKTFITCGILQALSQRGMKVNSFKCGPDYIDPMFHKQVLGVESGNLDGYFSDAKQLNWLLANRGKLGDISIIEGAMGYFDGIGGTHMEASAYDLAVKTHTPTILIVNARGMSASVLPVILGFMDFEKEKRIQGVILNQVSAMLYPRLKEKIEEKCKVKVLGYVPRLDHSVLESRHLGLVLPHEIVDIQQKLQELGSLLETTLDLDLLLSIATAAVPISVKEEPVFPKHNLRIAITKDEAFCFIYEDNCRRLKQGGVELVPFSPLRDKKLPENVDGVLLYGGYPELFLETLSEHTSLHEELRVKLEQGLPCIAECGGFMYLQQQIKGEKGESYPMIGYLEGTCEKQETLKRFGYIELNASDVFGENVGNLVAHEFHYYDSTCNGSHFMAKKPMSKVGWECGVQRDNLLAGYPHFYYYGNELLVEAFLNRCEQYKCRKSKEDMLVGMLKYMNKELELLLQQIKPLDQMAMQECQLRWNRIAKPLHSLGKMEDHLIKIAGIRGNSRISLQKKALIIMCADNGVVEEGVTQTTQEITAVVAENFLSKKATASILCQMSGTDIVPIDIGVARDTSILNYKIAYGTRNMTKEPAMTQEECLQAILTGIQIARQKKQEGYELLATGEMGIGNTTTSSSIASVLLQQPVERMTGRGAGLSTEGLNRKIQAIKKAIELHKLKQEETLRVLACVGGLDIAGLTGVFLGGAIYHIPVVIDGFISAVAALVATRLCKECQSYMIASHISKEPATKFLLDELQLEPSLTCDMCLGEGTGAVALFPLLDMAVAVYNQMSTFEENKIEEYTPQE